ncbi:MAG: hypothetical protein FWH14_05900 [Oscillospiraceae bacterium]|nr:hypothetical protein [Oscillospiraceae bacterium]
MEKISVTKNYEKYRDEFILELELCEDEEEIDDFFNEFSDEDLNTPEERLEFLKSYMCINGMGGMPDGDISAEDITKSYLSLLKQSFIEGSWRQLTNKYRNLKRNRTSA